jgi:hypothetical protein
MILIWIHFFSVSLFATGDPPGFMEIKEKMISLLSQARECLPQDNKLCTGVSFDKKELANLHRITLQDCKSELLKRGFRLIDDPELSEHHQSFINSTMRAQTLIKEKKVLYKSDNFNRIDCIHELLHVYQHGHELNEELAPRIRSTLTEKFITFLNIALKKVEAAEKDKNLREAKNLGSKVQTEINFIKTWNEMDNWLNEKDVHYFIYSQCDKFECTQLDKEIAISNLYRLSSYLPQKEALQIKNEASLILEAKERKAISEASQLWVPTIFSDDEFHQMSALSWDDLSKSLAVKNIKLLGVNHAYRLKDLEIIPKEIFSKIPPAPASLIKDSKILTGEAFAKFLPLEEENYILVTPITTKTSLIHEYLHFLQAKTNLRYRRSLQENPQLMNKFLQGQVPREIYEETALLNNALVWMGEYEVYKILIKFKKNIPEIEHLNNQELFEVFEKKLQKRQK